MAEIDSWETVDGGKVRFNAADYLTALLDLPAGVSYADVDGVVEIEAIFLPGVSL